MSLLPTLYSTRAYGKPSQFNTGDATSFRKAVDMTDDELAAIVARAKLTVIKTDWRAGRWRAFCGAGVSPGGSRLGPPTRVPQFSPTVS